MIDIAKKAAIEAGKEILSLRNKNLKIRKKGNDGDFATEADDSAEKIILEILKKDFPDFNYLSEESGKENNGSEYTWVIDPLDGTMSFSSGLDNFGVSIGLLKGYKPYLGVVNLPVSEELYWAVEGSGAYLNGEEIKVNDVSSLKDAVVGFDLAHQGQRKDEIEKVIAKFVDEVRYPPNYGATVTGLCYVAKGTFGGYMHSAYPWDFAAGSKIVEEAGGKVTDFAGEQVDWRKEWVDVVATNGKIHTEILKVIK
jgi:myo-inositol-1(or 4)-monophosphatase